MEQICTLALAAEQICTLTLAAEQMFHTSTERAIGRSQVCPSDLPPKNRSLCIQVLSVFLKTCLKDLSTCSCIGVRPTTHHLTCPPLTCCSFGWNGQLRSELRSPEWLTSFALSASVGSSMLIEGHFLTQASLCSYYVSRVAQYLIVQDQVSFVA